MRVCEVIPAPTARSNHLRQSGCSSLSHCSSAKQSRMRPSVTGSVTSLKPWATPRAPVNASGSCMMRVCCQSAPSPSRHTLDDSQVIMKARARGWGGGGGMFCRVLLHNCTSVMGLTKGILRSLVQSMTRASYAESLLSSSSPEASNFPLCGC